MGRTRFCATIVVALFLVGCGASVPRQVVVARSAADDPAVLWQRVLTTLRSAGYETFDANAGTGRIVVRARELGPLRMRSHFELQIYREGWVQLSIGGVLGSGRTSEQIQVSSGLASEYERLMLHLREHLSEEPSSDEET